MPINKTNKNDEINNEKLFPKLNNVDVMKLRIDKETISYITVPYDSKIITDILTDHISKKMDPTKCSIVDATGGAGGDSIMFCSKFANVVSIELDDIRYNFLKYNLEQYNFKNYTLINGDCTQIIMKLQNFDMIYVDPPWGGKDYKNKKNLRLMIGDISIEQFTLNCFNNDEILCIPKLIAFKIPKNYDLKYLFDILNEKFELTLYILRKIDILIIERK